MIWRKTWLQLRQIHYVFFIYISLKIYKTNYLLQYLLITLRNTTRTIIPRGAIDYDNPVAINIERNKNYRVNQERCTARPQSRTQGPPTDSHNSLRIYDALHYDTLCGVRIASPSRFINAYKEAADHTINQDFNVF